MDVRVPSDSERAAVVDRLLRPAYRDAEARDPAFSDLAEDAVAAEDCSRWLDDDARTMFVAYDPGPVGFVSGGVADSPALYSRGQRCYVDGLYVVGDRRREGVAGRLLEELSAWGRDRGAEYVSLSVHVDNDAANAFYRSQGFDVKFRSLRREL
ncbi:GNAT family N-acetyltransferase [Halobacterium yunchengense]|uniref:GNAT family N-acetyltransferase n=1 Tax=Halobacterium yunchengense TaxID=3108497 RepID=UPI00300963D3